MKTLSQDRMRRDLLHLCRDPLPFRKANWNRPGRKASSLQEADLYIREQLQATGCEVLSSVHRGQAFRCDRRKPIHHWYSKPQPEDPWYELENLQAVFTGRSHPQEIIQLVSHKDSMSWIDSPGAHDNATGTVANLEIARSLADYPLRRTVRILFCNEEHTPWTSRHAAEEAAARGDNIIAVLNVDSLDGKSDRDAAEGRLTHAVTYSTEEGQTLAQRVLATAARTGTDLEVTAVHKEKINDDDGMFINAGYRCTVMNVGSFPYRDPQYHLPGDTPERVNMENLALSAELILAVVLEIDATGMIEALP
jgi:hypothetical protein